MGDVQINIAKGQGMTQAIASKLNIDTATAKKIDVSVWKEVMQDVQSSKTINFTSSNNNLNALNDKTKNHSNFTVNAGNYQLGSDVWTKISNLLKNAVAALSGNKKPDAAAKTDADNKTEKPKPKETPETSENMQDSKGNIKFENTDKTAQFMMNNMDTDKKNNVSENEFIKAFVPDDMDINNPTDDDAKKNIADLKKAFTFSDLDGNGQISTDEMKIFLQNANADGNKSISSEELATYTDATSKLSPAEAKAYKTAISKGYQLKLDKDELKVVDKSGALHSIRDLSELTPHDEIGREDDATAISNEERRKNEDINHNGKIGE